MQGERDNAALGTSHAVALPLPPWFLIQWLWFGGGGRLMARRVPHSPYEEAVWCSG